VNSLLTFQKLLVFAINIFIERRADIMLSFLFLCGLIIVNLGIIAIYLGRAIDTHVEHSFYVLPKRVISNVFFV
jgi:uncharacterized protein (UPF0333 family)